MEKKIKLELRNKILKFMRVLHKCYHETNVANHRHMYCMDLMYAMDWIVKLDFDIPIDEVVNEILSPQTSKTFTDYYRGGQWGEMQCEAIEQLQNDIKRLSKE